MSALQNSDEKESASMPDSERTIHHVIQGAIEAENQSRHVYVQFSQMFAHVPDVAGFWQDLAYDEAKHAHTLKKTQDSLSSEQLATPADRKLLRSVAKTIALVDKISLETIRTLDNAYELAHELEFSELNYVFKCVAGDFIRQDEKKKIIFSEIEEHQRKLIDFIENFGDRISRRQILTRSASPIATG
jgi:rubrerythrin